MYNSKLPTWIFKKNSKNRIEYQCRQLSVGSCLVEIILKDDN